jgi:hypothetical protein
MPASGRVLPDEWRPPLTEAVWKRAIWVVAMFDWV